MEFGLEYVETALVEAPARIKSKGQMHNRSQSQRHLREGSKGASGPSAHSLNCHNESPTTCQATGRTCQEIEKATQPTPRRLVFLVWEGKMNIISTIIRKLHSLLESGKCYGKKKKIEKGGTRRWRKRQNAVVLQNMITNSAGGVQDVLLTSGLRQR